MTKFATLVSGSSGNAAFLSYGDTRILIDCGISGSLAKELLSRIDEDPSDIDCILVTHEHVDHIRGVGVMSRKYDLPIFASEGTWNGMESEIGRIAPENQYFFSDNSPFTIGDVEVQPFTIPHDALQPTGYHFRFGGHTAAIATDMGCVTDEIRSTLLGTDVVVLESNYDSRMLEHGRYHPKLKQRIRGKLGHLDNTDAGDFAAELVKSGTKRIVLGHLSVENNLVEQAYQTVAERMKVQNIIANRDAWLAVAKRYDITPICGLKC